MIVEHIYVTYDNMHGIYSNSFGASGIWVGTNNVGIGYVWYGADIEMVNFTEMLWITIQHKTLTICTNYSSKIHGSRAGVTNSGKW